MKQSHTEQNLSANTHILGHANKAGTTRAAFQQENGQIEGSPDQEDAIGTGHDFIRL